MRLPTVIMLLNIQSSTIYTRWYFKFKGQRPFFLPSKLNDVVCSRISLFAAAFFYRFYYDLHHTDCAFMSKGNLLTEKKKKTVHNIKCAMNFE